MDVYDTDLLSGKHPARGLQVYSAGESDVSFSERHPALHFERDFTGAIGICPVYADGIGGPADWRVGFPEKSGQVCPISVRVCYEQDCD